MKRNGNDDKGNVVEFPSHKVRPPKGSDEGLKSGRNRSVEIAISLVSTMVVVTFISAKWGSQQLQPSSSEQERGLASVDSNPGLADRTWEESKNLANEIKRQSIRKPASNGSNLSPEDSLKMVALHSRYRVVFTPPKNFVTEIVLDPNAGSVPKYVNLVDLLTDYRKLFGYEKGLPKLETREKLETKETALPQKTAASYFPRGTASTSAETIVFREVYSYQTETPAPGVYFCAFLNADDELIKLIRTERRAECQ
jgi:hypothetical protein